MGSFTTSQVADLLGMSTDTVRRWCDEGRLASERGAGGHRTIDGAVLAQYLVDQDDAYEPDSVMSQSARNRFTGVITRVDRDKLVAVVEIHAPPHRIVSLMT